LTGEDQHEVNSAKYDVRGRPPTGGRLRGFTVQTCESLGIAMTERDPRMSHTPDLRMPRTPHLYAESPIDPLWIGRHLAGAGLAFEKHRFGLPTRHGVTSPFEYGGDGGGDATARAEIRVDGLPLATKVALPALAPLHFVVVDEPDTIDGLVARYLDGLDAPLYLAFRNRSLSSPSAPHTINEVIASLLGPQWTARRSVQIVALDTSERRRAALAALAGEAGPSLYILAAPSQELVSTPPPLIEQLGRGVTTIAFDEFHALVAACSWVMTTHRRLVDAAPLVFYSTRDLRRELLGAGEAVIATSLFELPRHAEAVRGQVGVDGDLAGVVDLSLAGSPVTTLEDLLTAPDLRSLVLDHAATLDEESLARLTHLEALSLRGHWLRDGRLLAPLTRLRRLVLDLVPRAGVDTLAALTGLESLAIERQPLADLAFAAAHPRLRELTVEAAPDTRDFLAPLAALTALVQLEARGRGVVDLLPLARVPLAILHLGRTGVTDIAPLANVATLAELELPQTAVRDVSPLARLPALRRLNLFQTDVVDLTPVARNPALGELALGGGDAVDLTPLAAARSLATLDVQATRIPSLGAISGIASLSSLILRYCELPDLHPLGRLPALRYLDLTGTTQADLTVLTSLPALRTLVIEDGRLSASDIAHLAPRVAITSTPPRR